MAKGGGAGDWIADRATRAMIGAALAMPWERRVPFVGRLSRSAIAPAVGWRARALANLAHVWPDLPAARAREIADACADNAGRTMIENYAAREFGQRLRATEPVGAGLAVIECARAEGRPVLFLTGHFGNHEAPRHVLTQAGYRIGGLYKAMANPYFNTHYVRTMQDLSGPVYERGRRGTMAFARLLKAGGMATMLFDIHETRGTLLPFLGQPAPTTLSPAELALRFGAELVPYFGRRKEDGLGFDVIVEAPIPHGEAHAMMTEATRRLEARILTDPGQWFWIHRRWKPKRQAARAKAAG